MAVGALASQLAHLTDKDIKPSILSEPLKVFETDHSTTTVFGGPATGLGFPVVTTSVPRGRLWTNVPGLPNNAYTFSYNPQSIEVDTSWDSSISVISDAQGITSLGGAAHPPGLESINFDLLMNRIVEVAPGYTGPNSLLFSIYGTLCDLAVFYSAINGLSSDEIDQQLSGDSPAVPATNLGYIRPVVCTVSFGNGDFNYTGIVTLVQVNHFKFVNSMTPVLTTVRVGMQRFISTGALPGSGSSKGNPPSKTNAGGSPAHTGAGTPRPTPNRTPNNFPGTNIDPSTGVA